MTRPFLPRHTRLRTTAAASTLLLALTTTALAGPGAHGPNGEHLDAPATAVMASTLPRLVSQSESFELVAELRASELVIWVDRYQTNEPVMGAQIEVESGGLKAVAAFRAEQGDHAVTDKPLLQALAASGEHALVITLVAGAESDLLDGTLVVGTGGAAGAAGSHSHDHDHHHAWERAAWMGGGIAAVVLVGGFFLWWRHHRSPAKALKGAL